MLKYITCLKCKLFGYIYFLFDIYVCDCKYVIFVGISSVVLLVRIRKKVYFRYTSELSIQNVPREKKKKLSKNEKN